MSIELPIDKERARRAFDRAAHSYDDAAILQREIGRRLLERLDLVTLMPKTILDAGSGTGLMLEPIRQRYPKARLLALDFAPNMLQRARKRGSWWRRPACVAGDIEALPLVERGLDLVIANAALQWCARPQQAFAELLRVLRGEGLLMFTSFGPDTLTELRQAWAEIDGHAHVSPFQDMHDVGDQLQQAGFADPVMDVERITMTYASVDDLMRDMKSLGSRNAAQARPRGMTGRRRLAALRDAYDRFRRPDGSLPATYEVVYGHAWAPEQRKAIEENGEVRIGIDALRRSVGTAG